MAYDPLGRPEPAAAKWGGGSGWIINSSFEAANVMDENNIVGF